MGAALGLIGPLASIGGALFGGGSTANNVPQAPPVYQPTGAPQADRGVQGGIGQLGSSTVPQGISAANSIVNNPGAPGFEWGAGGAGQLGQAAGVQQWQQGQNLVGTGNSVVPYAYSALNAGFDPQRAMYNQEFQQNTDQTRALLEARGIDSTPYGAGVETDSNRKFNTNWDFSQLARQGQGAQTANSLFGTQANDVLQGANLSGQAPGTYYTGSAMPYNAFQQIGSNSLGALGQSQSLQQTPIQDYLQYLQAANQASQIGTQQQQTNLNQNQLGWNQNQQLGQNLGAGIQGLGKGWSNWQNNTPGWAQSNPGASGSAYYGPVAV